jgi:uncharacterized protein YbcI
MHTTLLERPKALRSVDHQKLLMTQGEMEAAICKGMSRFEQDYLGRGPKDIHAHLIGDIIVVRLQGALTATEKHLASTQPDEKGRELLKQVRTQLLEAARPVLESWIHAITGTKLLSLHHDISTLTGEQIVVFTLVEAPRVRESKKKISRLGVSPGFCDGTVASAKTANPNIRT